jgi:hypothetical protein
MELLTLTIIKLHDEDMTDDTYKGKAVGGPLYGGSDSVKIDEEIRIGVPRFQRHDKTLAFNAVEIFSRKYVEMSVLILEVGPDEELVCFTKERAKDLNGVSVECTVKAIVVKMATTIANRGNFALRKFVILLCAPLQS